MISAAPPTFDLETCRDLREKLHRELCRFKNAGPRDEQADHAFNFMVTAWHMCDWVARDASRALGYQHPKLAEIVSASHKETVRRVQELARERCPKLEICQSFANASKHAEASRRTLEHRASANATFDDDVDTGTLVSLVTAMATDKVTWDWRIKSSAGEERAEAFFDHIYSFWHGFIDEYIPDLPPAL